VPDFEETAGRAQIFHRLPPGGVGATLSRAFVTLGYK
jgi:hypothetical protein